LIEEKPLCNVEYDFKNQSPWVRPNRIWEKLLPKSVPKTIKYPEIPLHYIGREAARKFPHNLAIYFVPEERKYTYQEMMYWSDKNG
jgi:hypothetical protein